MRMIIILQCFLVERRSIGWWSDRSHVLKDRQEETRYLYFEKTGDDPWDYPLNRGGRY